MCAVVQRRRSGIVVQRLALPVIRLLEGYWPGWLSGPRQWLVERQSARQDRVSARLRELAGVELTARTPREFAEFVRLDQRRHRVPARREMRMPTRLGNVLRAAESRPADRYGLDAVVC